MLPKGGSSSQLTIEAETMIAMGRTQILPAALQHQAMDGVRMVAVELGIAGHRGGDDVHRLAAEPSEVVVERHRGPALGRQEQLGDRGIESDRRCRQVAVARAEAQQFRC